MQGLWVEVSRKLEARGKDRRLSLKGAHPGFLHLQAAALPSWSSHYRKEAEDGYGLTGVS